MGAPSTGARMRLSRARKPGAHVAWKGPSEHDCTVDDLVHAILEPLARRPGSPDPGGGVAPGRGPAGAPPIPLAPGER